MPAPQRLLLIAGLLLSLCGRHLRTVCADMLADDIARCPRHQQHFQKILGYRPDFQLIGSTHELFPTTTTTTLAPGGNDINATAFSRDLNANNGGVGREMPRRDAINADCWQLCSEAAECAGYVLFLNVSQCFGVTQHNRTSKFYTPLRSAGLLLDSNSVYFEKICLGNVPAIYRTKMWLFTKIPGTGLVQQARKTLPMLVTRARCAQQCLLEEEFVCLSATFLASHRNNLVRSDISVLPDSAHELGTCALSTKDKSSQPDAFRVSTSDEEYIENQCAQRPRENDQCAYESYPHSRLGYADVSYDDLAKGQCTAHCATEQRFYCQGFSYGWYNGRSRCILHSEDVISLGPRALLTDRDFVYERRVKCLNVSVICSRSLMAIRYNPSDVFSGRIYVNGHSDECTSKGNDNNTAILRITIGNEERERHCGVLRAYQIDKATHTNRTLLSTLVVVQMNPIVQTQGDRLVKVGCIIDNHVHADGNIDDISLASTLGFDSGLTSAAPTSDGAPLFNTTGTAPRVAMRIVDVGRTSAAAGSVTDVALGQNLELQITLEPADSAYDIRATNLIARSDTGHSSILLLDPKGCATDASVFPAMMRRTEGGTRILFARFHAFKFAGSGYVNFEVVIRFCRGECEPEQCNTPKRSGKRRRRSSGMEIRYGEPIAVIAGAQERKRPARVYGGTSTAIADDVHRQNVTEHNQIRVDSNEVISQRVLGQIAGEIEAADVRQQQNGGHAKRVLPAEPTLAAVPLRLQLSVRVPEAATAGNSESLIYGESTAGGADVVQLAGVGGVGGADVGNANFMCINRTFVILLGVLWLLLQVIVLAVCGVCVRRYKRLANAEDDQRELQKAAMAENFGFGSSVDMHRRVRWADQGRSRVLMYT